MRKGLNIDGHTTRPAQVTGKRKGPERAAQGQLNFVLVEGRKHQIRKMCKKVGLKVTDLKRVRLGSLKMGGLEEGKYRQVQVKEIEALQKSVESEMKKNAK